MAEHTCHALGCKARCRPAMLMCYPCWSLVPEDMQREVYRTVRLRGKYVDKTWAPWWRAQAKAIAFVAFLKSPLEEKRDAYLRRELGFADMLESRDG